MAALLDISNAFVPASAVNCPNRMSYKTEMTLQESTVESDASSTEAAPVEKTTVSVPLTWDQMIRQVATAMKDASAQGTTRQIVRILLPRDSSYDNFGTQLESNTEDSMSVSLVPLDESWQGGIMQLYYAAAPTTEKIMQQFTAGTAGGVPPRIVEDRSVDESGVDGVSLFKADDNQIACWLRARQENIDEIEKMTANTADDDIVALINPQWRLVDDALDTASQNDGFWGGVANFLGGKGGALKRLKAAGFTPVYTFEGYVCRGANVRMLQVLDSDWSVFCERDDGQSFIPVGTMKDRPTYQDVEKMLNDNDIGYKYARDIGMAPKL